jgi:cyclomaltodextrinase
VDQRGDPRPGRYRHFKGREYQVIGVARHSESEELLVVYRPLYGEGLLWARPLPMFSEEVEHEGVRQPRFAYVGEM